MELSARYINDRKLPDKAIDVIDEVGAAQMLVAPSKRKKTIRREGDRGDRARKWRAFRRRACRRDDKTVSAKLETRAEEPWCSARTRRIDALQRRSNWPAPACASRRSRSASTCSRGPTGVGKTEVRATRQSLGIELVRFDMSEYMERHSSAALIGAPPGYVGFDQGGMLTDAVDQEPALRAAAGRDREGASGCLNILLQIMDHGKLTDHNGKTVDFRNVILIMTTNAGAADLAKSAMGFGRSREGDDTEAINRMFTPEFRNRLDAIVPFGNLPPQSLAVSSTSSCWSWRPAGRPRRFYRTVGGRPQLAGEEGLQPGLRRPSVGTRHSGAYKEAAGGGIAVR